MKKIVKFYKESIMLSIVVILAINFCCCKQKKTATNITETSDVIPGDTSMVVILPLDTTESAIDLIFKMNLEQHTISRGDNKPDFNAENDSMDFLLFAFHKNVPISVFMEKTGFTQEKMMNTIQFLEGKNWLYEVDNLYKPTIFVADKIDGEKLYKYAEPISTAIVEEIKKELPDIEKQFMRTEIAKKQSFAVWSFFILSDVLLDNWQINNVEKEFLKQNERPLRHGKRYYYKISEKTGDEESFGIYGNQYNSQNGRSVYGNNRNNVIEDDELHIISASDYKVFDKTAQHFLPRLLKVLNANTNYAENVYKKTGYSEEISFEEFFIWWYHFIYTQTTDKLAEENLLAIPESGNFIYEIKK